MVEKLDPEYDSQIKSLKLELLRTQRYLAQYALVYAHNDCQERLLRSGRDVNKSLSRQMQTEATADTAKIRTSPDPLSISRSFADKWYDKLNELGIKLVSFS